MKTNYLEEKDIQTAFPKNKNDKFLKNEEYIKLYNLYRKLFSEYIIKELKLKEFDEEIEKSGLRFKKLEEDAMDIYQYFTSNVLNYIYIRNNIYIENIGKENIEKLKEYLKEKREELDEEITEFIQNTYKAAIYERVGDDGEKCITFYGPDSSSYMAPNDALVLGLRYDEFDYNGMDDETWGKYHDEQYKFFPMVLSEIVENNQEKFDIPIEVLFYNDYSVNYRPIEEMENSDETR